MEQNQIRSLIEQLANANADANAHFAEAVSFNRTIQDSLIGINEQITQINTSIQGLQERLAESERQLGENQATIAANEAENTRLAEESAQANRESEEAARNLQDLDAQRIRLEQAAARQAEENAQSLRQLQDQQTNEMEALRNASAEDSARLREELERTNAEIARINQNNADAETVLEERIEDLNRQSTALQTEIADSRAEIARIEQQRAALQASSEDLRRINEELSELLTDASTQMEAAIGNLNSLSNAGDKDEINRIIELINGQLTEINNLLGIAPRAAPGARPELPLDRPIIFPNRDQTTLGAIKNALNAINWPSDEKIRISSVLDNVDNPNYETDVLNAFRGRDLDGLFRKIRGGRKTKKKNRKNNRKTKKLRKQKGGYHYRRNRPSTSRRSATSKTSSTTGKRSKTAKRTSLL